MACSFLFRVDVLHLIGVERDQFGALALGAQRDSDAVGAVGIDPRGHALLAVGKDFDDALIDENPQLERLARSEDDRGGLWSAGEHVGRDRRIRGVERDQTLVVVAAKDAVAKAPVFEKGNARVLLFAGSAQDIEFDHGRVLRIDFSDDFHGVASNRIENEFLVGRKRSFADALMIPPKRLKVPGRLHGQVVADHGQPTGQGHNLVPVLGRFAGVHVEDDQDAALAVGGRRGSVDARGCGRAKVELGTVSHDEFVALGVVVAEQVLAAASMAEEEEDVAVANRPEIGTGTVVAD